MINLLDETKRALDLHQINPSRVLWVGSADGEHAIFWDDFVKIADFSYHSGYGGQEIARDIVIVGSDFWLSRGEYDGSEWWEYNTKPFKKEVTLPFTTVHNGDSWATIEEMNRPGGKYSE